MASAPSNEHEETIESLRSQVEASELVNRLGLGRPINSLASDISAMDEASKERCSDESRTLSEMAMRLYKKETANVEQLEAQLEVSRKAVRTIGEYVVDTKGFLAGFQVVEEMAQAAAVQSSVAQALQALQATQLEMQSRAKEAERVKLMTELAALKAKRAALEDAA